MSTHVLAAPLPGARLARQLRDRLPDWLCRPSGADSVDMDDPTGVWHLSIRGDATVDLRRRGERGQPEPAGQLYCPDPGALAAFLTVLRYRAEVGR